MAEQPETKRGDYDYKKEEVLKHLAGVFENILQEFGEDDNLRIREDLANYTVGYMGATFGLHVKK